ncbi:MAG: phosphoribosylglycinamide formyltransferase [Rhodobacterales bacterium]|nr:MAG: phosphoribosylglycinamide formyltransferase [Rhodobacterales bacterium]
MTKRVAILISGSGSNMVALVKAMQQPGYPGQPVLVVSNRPEAAGLAKARDLGVATAVVDHKPYGADRAAFEAALSAALEQAQPDVICLAGFMRILTGDFVARWQGKILNIHPSLLPKYKGLHTHLRAIEAGDQQAGCSVHQVTAALDDGPVLGQARLPILPDDTPETLAARILPLEHQLYPEVLRRFLIGETEPLMIG